MRRRLVAAALVLLTATGCSEGGAGDSRPEPRQDERAVAPTDELSAAELEAALLEEVPGLDEPREASTEDVSSQAAELAPDDDLCEAMLQGSALVAGASAAVRGQLLLALGEEHGVSVTEFLTSASPAVLERRLAQLERVSPTDCAFQQATETSLRPLDAGDFGLDASVGYLVMENGGSTPKTAFWYGRYGSVGITVGGDLDGSGEVSEQNVEAFVRAVEAAVDEVRAELSTPS